MDSDRLDSLARSLASATSRRAALVGLIGGLVGVLEHGEALADPRDRKFRHRVKRRIKRLRRGQNAPVTPGPQCASADGCGFPFCENNGVRCFCWNLPRGGTHCGGSVFDVLNCSQCPIPNTCVDMTGCGGGVACSAPCGTD